MAKAELAGPAPGCTRLTGSGVSSWWLGRRTAMSLGGARPCPECLLCCGHRVMVLHDAMLSTWRPLPRIPGVRRHVAASLICRVAPAIHFWHAMSGGGTSASLHCKVLWVSLRWFEFPCGLMACMCCSIVLLWRSFGQCRRRLLTCAWFSIVPQ